MSRQNQFAIHICTFTQGFYRVQHPRNKQVLYFEDTEMFGPYKWDERKDIPLEMPAKSWFWGFYQPWREAGRPTEGLTPNKFYEVHRAKWCGEMVLLP